MTGDATATCCRRAAAVLGIFLVILILLWPAILNGFPIVYDDTSAYISFRTLRRFPPFYNVLPLLARMLGTLWAVILAQAVLTTYIVTRSLQLLAQGVSGAGAVVLAGIIGSVSQLPWLVCYLMPDLFGGLGLLALITAVFAWHRVIFAERLILLAIVLFSSLVATANAFVFVPIAAGLLLTRRTAGRLHNLLPSLLAIAVLTVVLPVASNWALGAGPTFAGGSSARMFSKLVDNGLAVPFLEQHCGKENFHACNDLALIRAHVGDEGFLWKGPANAHDNLAWKDADGDYARLNRQIMLDRPLAVVRFMVRDSIILASRVTLTTGNTGEIAPHPSGGVPFFVNQHFPGDDQAFARAKQQTGLLPRVFPEPAYAISAVTGFVLTLCSLWLFWYVRDKLGFSISVWIIIAVAFALVVHGSLSYPVARYNAKVAWLLWVVPALWLSRSELLVRARRLQISRRVMTR
ncbi:MAG TPA: hypothetical protein VFW35_06565 [Sphingomicrobium sp.]|nr:hypothetical protein [Sphingomicrobium sp.]